MIYIKSIIEKKYHILLYILKVLYNENIFMTLCVYICEYLGMIESVLIFNCNLWLLKNESNVSKFQRIRLALCMLQSQSVFLSKSCLPRELAFFPKAHVFSLVSTNQSELKLPILLYSI